MYSDGVMGHRMQITLSDEQYERLRCHSQETGSPIAEVVRRSLDATLARPLSPEDKLARLRATRGAWADRGEEVYAEWRAMRGDRAATR